MRDGWEGPCREPMLCARERQSSRLTRQTKVLQLPILSCSHTKALRVSHYSALGFKQHLANNRSADALQLHRHSVYKQIHSYIHTQCTNRYTEGR